MSGETQYNRHRFTGTFVRATERGVCLNIEGEDVWLPKSQITKISPEAPCQEGDTTEVEVPEWLAKEKGLYDD